MAAPIQCVDEIGRLAQHLTSNTVFHVLSVVCNAVSLVLLTRVLGTVGFGQVALLLVTMNFLSIFAEWPIFSLTRFGREERELCGSIRVTVGAAATLLLTSLILVDGIAIWQRGQLARFNQVGTAAFFLLLAAHNLRALARGSRELIRSTGKMHIYGLLAFIPIALSLLLILLAFAFGMLSLYFVVAAWALSNGIAFLFGLILIPREWLVPKWPGFRQLGRMMNYSYPYVPSACMYLLLTSTDLVFLRASPTAEHAVGHYGFAAMFYHQMIAIPALLSALLFPLLVGVRTRSTGDSEIGYYIQRIWPNITFPMVLMMQIPMVFVRPILLIPGAEYARAEVPFILLCSSACIVALRQPAGPLLAAYDFVKPIALVSIVQTFTNVLLNSLWVPRYGMAGAASATVASSLTGGVMAYALIRFRFKQFNQRILILLASMATTTMICLLVESTAFRFSLWCIHLLALVLIIRQMRVLHAEDIELAERVGLPKPIQRLHSMLVRALVS